MDLSHRQRAMIAEHFAAADLPQNIPEPVESIPSIAGIVCAAATDGGNYLRQFIEMLQALIPDKEVEHHYVAVRILLMCPNAYGIHMTFEYLGRALLKARDRPEMAGWWHSQKNGEGSERRTIYHRPKAEFDL